MFERQFQIEIYTLKLGCNFGSYILESLTPFERPITQLSESARIVIIAFNLEEL